MKKKIISGFLIAFLVVFMSFGKNVFAANLADPPEGKVIITTDLKASPNTNLKDIKISGPLSLSFVEDEAGNKYLCLESRKSYPTNGEEYDANEILKDPVATWLLYNYYHDKEIISGENEETQYAITQLAIWVLENPEKYAEQPVIKNNKIINDLIAKAKTHENDLTADEVMNRIEGLLSPIKQNFKLNNDKTRYVAEITQTIEKPQSALNFNIEDVVTFNYDNVDITSKIKVETSNGKKIISIDKQFFDSIYKEGISLKMDLKAKISGEFNVGVMYGKNNSIYQKVGNVKGVTLAKNIATSAEIGIEKEAVKGKIEINKVDSSSKKGLADAKFEVKDVNGNIVSTVTSDKNGKALVEDLVLGKYTVEEVSAPTGYKKVSDKFEITLDENTPNLTYKLTVENEKDTSIKTGSIKIVKREDGTDKILKGAEFVLLDSNKKEIGKQTTNDKGEIIFSDVAFGKYYVKEIKAPNGYVLDSKLREVEISEESGNTEQTLTVYNKLDKKTVLPKTGDNSINPIYLTVIGMVFVVSGFVLKKKVK